MANWNGLVASLTKDGSTVSATLSGISFSRVNGEMPNKFFPHGQFAVVATQGVSGVFAVNVIGAVGGATFAIAGRTNISAVGSFPVPLTVYGNSGSQTDTGIPRPYGVQFESAKGVVGFTASVYFAGEY